MWIAERCSRWLANRGYCGLAEQVRAEAERAGSADQFLTVVERRFPLISAPQEDGLSWPRRMLRNYRMPKPDVRRMRALDPHR